MRRAAEVVVGDAALFQFANRFENQKGRNAARRFTARAASVFAASFVSERHNEICRRELSAVVGKYDKSMPALAVFAPKLPVVFVRTNHETPVCCFGK